MSDSKPKGLKTTNEEKLAFKSLKDAILNESFEKVPKKYLQAKYFFLEDENKHNIVQRAAYRGKLDCIPKEFVTQDLLLGKAKSTERSTGLHFAAQEGQLNLVPKDLLTEEHMFKEDQLGRSVYENAVIMGHVRQIPQELLTDHNILKRTSMGRNVLETLQDEMDWRSSIEEQDMRYIKAAKYLIRKLSNKGLKELTVNKDQGGKIPFLKQIKEEVQLRKTLCNLSEEALNL